MMIENPFSLQLIKKVLLAGLVVGSLDITAAFIDAWFSAHTTPDKVLNFIAGSAIGYENANGSFPIIVFGLFLHFFIAYCFTFLFYFAYGNLKSFFKNNIVIGILYGIFIWATMRFVILPFLSHIQFDKFNIIKSLKPMLILIGAIGIPLSLMMNSIAKSTIEKKSFYKNGKRPSNDKS